jgi:hypothetical protein
VKTSDLLGTGKVNSGQAALMQNKPLHTVPACGHFILVRIGNLYEELKMMRILFTDSMNLRTSIPATEAQFKVGLLRTFRTDF